VPAVDGSERAGDDRGDEGADVDADIIELEGIGLAAVAGGVERLDLRAEIAAQQPDAEDEQEQGQEEGGVEGQSEMARGHQQGAEGHGDAAPGDPIADGAADDRREIDEADIEAEGLGAERLDGERTGDRLDRGAIDRKAGDTLDVARQKQRLDHVEHEQGLHAVERDAVPELGAGEDPQAAGMIEKPGPGRRRLGDGGGGHGGPRITGRKNAERDSSQTPLAETG